MASDANATGQALYALNVAGKMAVSNPVYQKGIDYLLRKQASDGSVACRDTRDLAAAVFRERVSLRPRPVHLGGWNGVGCDGAHAGGAGAAVDYSTVGSADAVSPRASASARASGINAPRRKQPRIVPGRAMLSRARCSDRGAA